MSIEKISLRERLIALDEPFPGFGEKHKQVKKYPLKLRISKAEEGESCEDEEDTAPYQKILEKSSSLKLSAIIRAEKYSEMKNKVYDYEELDKRPSFPETYSQCVELVAQSWKDMWLDGYSFDMDFLNYRQKDFFDILTGAFRAEILRRRDSHTFAEICYKDASKSFPAFSMPLPMYFKAAAGRCTNRLTALFLSKLYAERYRSLLINNPPLSNYARKLIKYQPDKSTVYCDAATMVEVVCYASEQRFVSRELKDEMLCELVIAPFFTY